MLTGKNFTCPECKVSCNKKGDHFTCPECGRNYGMIETSVNGEKMSTEEICNRLVSMQFDMEVETYNCPSCGKKLANEHGWKFCGNRDCRIYLDIGSIVSRGKKEATVART